MNEGEVLIVLAVIRVRVSIVGLAIIVVFLDGRERFFENLALSFGSGFTVNQNHPL
jgi:hypothetical protein